MFLTFVIRTSSCFTVCCSLATTAWLKNLLVPDTQTVQSTFLDKFWMHQDVKYDFAADLTGIGYRSVREISKL